MLKKQEPPGLKDGIHINQNTLATHIQTYYLSDRGSPTPKILILITLCYFQLRKSEQEADLRPITPSKIPVGAWRAEEEKAINRALNGSMDSNRDERSVSPNPPPTVSRIPKIALKLGNNYRTVQVSLWLFSRVTIDDLVT